MLIFTGAEMYLFSCCGVLLDRRAHTSNWLRGFCRATVACHAPFARCQRLVSSAIVFFELCSFGPAAPACRTDVEVKAGLVVQRNLFHKMAWLDAPLFRMVASLRYANSAGAPTTPGPDHWRKVLVRNPYSFVANSFRSISVKRIRNWCWLRLFARNSSGFVRSGFLVVIGVCRQYGTRPAQPQCLPMVLVLFPPPPHPIAKCRQSVNSQSQFRRDFWSILIPSGSIIRAGLH